MRADYLVSQMTLAEKMQLVHGGAALDWWNHTLPRGAAGWIPGIPRLNIPDLYFADGSVGVGNGVGQSTALPSSIASAASWDLNEAAKYGQVIGAEMRAYGINVNLGGNVNLIGREPRDGRTFETKGEDPILAGKIKAAHIKAIQSPTSSWRASSTSASTTRRADADGQRCDRRAFRPRERLAGI